MAENETLNRLRQRLGEVHQLHMASALLDWDQQTYMPPESVQARSEQKAALTRISHNLFTAPETGDLIAAAEQQAAGGDADDPVVDALVRVSRRDYDRATRIPVDLMSERVRVTALAQEEWAAARAADDYPRFAPWLRRVIDLERQVADALGWTGRRYDALLDQYEPGMTSARVDELFTELKEGLSLLVREIGEKASGVSDAVLHREFPVDLQAEAGLEILAECGFDLRRGRLDSAVHPFCTHFSQSDVRLTTRYDAGFFSAAFFGTMHEMGHGLYEQNIDPRYEGTAVSSGCSLGLHESQSRLWENLVGRSRDFWIWYFPRLKQRFDCLADVDVEQWYRAINRVAPSLIRVEADEVTYNLHIILRYEMENELLDGRLSVEDAPQEWDERIHALLGIRPLTDREGILQDVHWSIGILGYFPTYTLGNVLSVQIFNRAVSQAPGIPAGIEKGRFAPLLGWLRENVLTHGRALLPDELVRQATGQPVTAQPYLTYLRRKYGEIYGL